MTAHLVDLAAGDTRTCRADLRLPDDPLALWYAVVVVPVRRDDIEDPTVSARQVALDAAMCARETVEALVYPAVLEHRKDNRTRD